MKNPHKFVAHTAGDKHVIFCEKCGQDPNILMIMRGSEGDHVGCPYEEHHVPSGVEALVAADIASRQQRGIAKYGVTVAENPLSLVQWLTHAYHEVLDLAIYLRRTMEELQKTEILKNRNYDTGK